MLETIIKGGSMMVPIMALSVAGLAVLFDRAFAFWKFSKVDNRALRAKVLTYLAQNRIQDAANLCANTPGPISAVILTGLQCFVRHKARTENIPAVTAIMREQMQDYALRALSAVEKRMYVLSTVGMAAPLFGMCGTVTGMITSFKAIASAGAIDGSLVASGISEALITTAAGLIIALFCVIPYNMFTSDVERINLEIDESIAELLDFVATKMENA
jgi:biopolymer transport protein ExbB